MRTVTVDLVPAGALARATYRVSFRDDGDKAMAVMRLRAGKNPKAHAITCPEARAAVAAAVALLPPRPVSKRRNS